MYELTLTINNVGKLSHSHRLVLVPGSYTYTINIKVPENDNRVIITGHVNLIR